MKRLLQMFKKKKQPDWFYQDLTNGLDEWLMEFEK